MRRQATLVPQFTGDPYGPGDQVRGALVAREPEGAEAEHIPALRRSLAVVLRRRDLRRRRAAPRGLRRCGAGDPVRAPHPGGRIPQLGGFIDLPVRRAGMVDRHRVGHRRRIRHDHHPLDPRSTRTRSGRVPSRPARGRPRRWSRGGTSRSSRSGGRFAAATSSTSRFGSESRRPSAPSSRWRCSASSSTTSRPRNPASPTGARSTASTWSRSGPSSTPRSPSRRSR